MKHFLILAGLGLFTAGTVAADSIVAANKQTKTIACAKDGVVLIAGNDNTIKLTGKCKLVHVPGNHNKITAESAAAISADGNENSVVVTAVDAITINGNKNSVTWSKTLDGDEAPDVSELGDGNKVTKKL